MYKTLVRLGLVVLMSLTTLAPAPSAAQRRAPAEEAQIPARIPGLIDVSPEGKRDVITGPSTVRAGESFKITITTSGGGCERAGDVGVILGESDAIVMIYDFTVATRPGVACTMIYKRMPHIATLRFAKRGEALIRVWGRRVGSDTPHFGVPAVIEHRIMVK